MFALMRSWHESLFALKILLFDLDTCLNTRYIFRHKLLRPKCSNIYVQIYFYFNKTEGMTLMICICEMWFSL